VRSDSGSGADYGGFEALCEDLGYEFHAEKRLRLENYRKAILEWNNKINLISRRDEGRLVSYHFLDSAEGLAYLREIDTRVLDLGSGAGLPGIVWTILNPRVEMTLVEATRKRALFLERAARVLDLGRITVIRARAESAAVQSRLRSRFDAAVARTVAGLPELIRICLPLLCPGGRLIAYKGMGGEEELEEAGQILEDLGGEVVQVAPAVSASLKDKRVFVIIQRV
jgi:16S rRNA (guanine527-N7)-methyltransferase